MTPEEMAASAIQALAGGVNMTLVHERGKKMPRKFPRGELLCKNPNDGSRCYSYDPKKILSWLGVMGFVNVVSASRIKP